MALSAATPSPTYGLGGATTGDFMGTGEWAELKLSNIPGSYTAYTFANQADVLTHARLAGDAVGATKMDRPEWVTLTNNKDRTVADEANAGSSNVTAENTFNSPDGLGFDKFGRLWIQTDGNHTNTGNFAGQGNNSMLAADPVSKEIRRFLVGPKQCEVTGLTFTPDSKTLFINIQHPGENGAGGSTWPDGGTNMPRSATVIITKNDGGVIGT